MSGRSVEDLPMPPLEFRVDQGVAAEVCDFETRVEKVREDASRAKSLRKAASKFPTSLDAQAAHWLADRLEQSARRRRDCESTLASSVDMMEWRIKTSGAIWRLVEDVGPLNVRFYTIIPKTWECEPEKLSSKSPRKLMDAFRTELYSNGAKSASGWMIAFVHGEWDPAGKVYRLHTHAFAYGDIVDVIESLRKLDNYKTQLGLKNGRVSPVARRIRTTWEELTDLPRPITYLLKSYWPSKPVLISDDGKERVRGRKPRRIKEPEHSRVLLWLDRWRLKDLTLMIGLRVTKHGLKQTNLVS